MAQAPSEGQVEGICVIWNEPIINLTEIAVTNQEIHCMVQVCQNELPFMLSAIYASPRLQCRQILWQNLKHVVILIRDLD